MLDSRYQVRDNSWQDYPSAASVQQLIQAQKGLMIEESHEADSLIDQIALSTGRDINIPSELSEEEFQLLHVTFNQAKDVIDYFEAVLKAKL